MEHGDRKDPFYVITLPYKGKPDIYRVNEKYSIKKATMALKSSWP